MPLTTEEITGCNNYAVTGANKVIRNLPSSCFISCFTVSVMTSINTLESSSDLINIIISFMSSFEINKVWNSDSSFSTYFSFKSIHYIWSCIWN